MKITAKFAGKCVKCDGHIAVGESIYWERGSGAKVGRRPYSKPKSPRASRGGFSFVMVARAATYPRCLLLSVAISQIPP